MVERDSGIVGEWTVGEYNEEMPWQIVVDWCAQNPKSVCKHAVYVGNDGPYKLYRIPRVVTCANEGGFNGTVLCVDCILNALAQSQCNWPIRAGSNIAAGQPLYLDQWGKARPCKGDMTSTLYAVSSAKRGEQVKAAFREAGVEKPKPPPIRTGPEVSIPREVQP